MKNVWTNYKNLLSEWHPYKNGDEKPEDFIGRTSEKAWWKCPKGSDHEWEAKIVSRMSGGRGCPFCSNRRISITNSLQKINPKIASEWHPKKNGATTSNEVVAMSGKKAWWKCPKGPDHEWEVQIYKRVTRGNGCPYCSGYYVSESNNLKKLYPKIAAEWDIEKNGGLKPQEITYGSTKKIWWTCKKNHSYQASPNSRTSSGNGCPFCSGNKVCDDNSLQTLYPDIAAEWHPDKNAPETPSDFTYGSNKKAWWACPRGHDYIAAIKSRTGNRNSCPLCSHHSSAPEIRIFTELKTIFFDVEYRKKIDGKEVDIFIPIYQIAIEYDGSYFHRNMEERDLKKNTFLKTKGIEVIRLRHKPLKKLAKNDLIVNADAISKSDMNQLLKLLSKLAEENEIKRIDRYLQRKSFANEKLFREYLLYTRSTVPEKSLALLFPEIAIEWHTIKNIPLKAENFPAGSHQKVWWTCKEGHEYTASIKGRTSRDKRGCPECSGNKVGADNNLLKKFPEVAAEWHPTKNLPKTPYDFTHGTKQKVWWLCPKGHESFSRINNRTRTVKRAGCPQCGILSRRRNF